MATGRRTEGLRLLAAALGRDGVRACEIARKLGVTPGCLSRLASGERSRPSIDLAFALEDRLGISARAWTRAIVPRGNGDAVKVEASTGRERGEEQTMGEQKAPKWAPPQPKPERVGIEKLVDPMPGVRRGMTPPPDDGGASGGPAGGNPLPKGNNGPEVDSYPKGG